MLRIHEIYCQDWSQQGRFFVLVETDVREYSTFLRFIKVALDFSEEYFRKVRFALRDAEPDPEGAARIAAAREDRARALGIYQTIPGSRSERLRILQERLKAEGRTETLSGVQMILAMANAEERELSACEREVESSHIFPASVGRTAVETEPREERPDERDERPYALRK